jgi:hypothetical protein
MIHRRSPFSVFVAALFLAAALPSLARADTASSLATGVDPMTIPRLSALAGADTPSSRATLDPAQVDAFAALVGESTSTVAQRIATDPSLVPFAAKAADARMRRKHIGKVLTITGFTILGVGSVIGLELIISNVGSSINCPEAPTACNPSGYTVLPGLVVALVSEAIGLAVAIPGIVKMASQSEAETEALARYHPVAATNDGSTSSSWPTQSLRAGMPETPMRPTGLLLPLLSGTL